ncbi:hypothetical protein D3C86_717860 [compost metagenome]
MTEGVVDGLEVIEVDEQQGADQVLAARLAERLGQGLVELAAIGQTGQLVVIGEILDAALRRLTLGDVFEEDDVVADAPLVILHRRDDFPLGIDMAVGMQAQGLTLPAIQGVELIAEPPEPGPEVVAKVQAYHPLAVEAGDLAEGVVDPQDLEVGIRDDDAFVRLERHRREPHQGVALQALQLGHHAHREDGQHGSQIGGLGLVREQQGEMAQDLATAIQQGLGIVVLARGQAGTAGQGFADGGRTGGAPIELLAGHVCQGVLLEVDAVARQHPEPVKAHPLRQPDSVGPQDMGKLVDQGMAEIEASPRGERLRQLGQQGGLQQGKRRGQTGGRLDAASGVVSHLQGRQPAAAELLGRHILAVPEHVMHCACLIAEVADELAGLARMVESCEKIGETGLIFWRQLAGPGMSPFPLPGLAREMIRQTPLLMLPIIKPHHLGGLLLHLRLQHYNHVIHPDTCRKAYPFVRISPPAHGNPFAMR